MHSQIRQVIPRAWMAALLAGAVLVLGCDNRKRRSTESTELYEHTGSTEKESAGPTKELSPKSLVLEQATAKELSSALDRLKGKLVVVYFWDRQSDASKQRLTDLVALQKEFGDKLTCVTVALNTYPEDEALAKPILKEKGIYFTTYYVGDDTGEVQHNWGVPETLPCMILLNEMGKPIKKFSAKSTLDDVKKQIRDRLKS